MLKEHAHKLVMLIALLSGQRTQTITLMDITNIQFTDAGGCLIYITSTSAAKAAGVSIDEILSSAGRSNCATFQTFYNKPVENGASFAEA
ncbi:Hypothetical predicted protein, partial [Paramuricea clavata]